MLRFLNHINKTMPVDIFINNRKVVSQLEYGAYSAQFDAKLGLYTIEVFANNELLLQMNFQLRHPDTIIILTGIPPEIELRIIAAGDHTGSPLQGAIVGRDDPARRKRTPYMASLQVKATQKRLSPRVLRLATAFLCVG